MREARWVNRFLFAGADTLFFDPLDAYIRPSPDHFLAALDESTRELFEHRGIWWSYRHNPDLPAQGWKIHVSANHRNARTVAAAVIGYLTGRGVDFKIALDPSVFELLNLKSSSRGSGGKFITVYPRDDDEFRACLADLARVLEAEEGAYVLSDLRYRDCKALYFRYGQFLDTHSLDVMGRRVPHITGPDGPVADQRTARFVQPWWVPWPFTDWKPEDDTDEEELLGGRFRVTAALQFSNSGGVYRAQDTADGDRLVVLKEARPHTNANPRLGYDAVDVLDREWAFLNRLADTGAFPAPIARFRHWEHHFIAEEFLDKVDIRSVLLVHNPLARPGFDVDRSREFLRIFLTVFRGLAGAVRAAHDRGVVLGDLSAANVLVDPDTFEVAIVDLEACRSVDAEAGDTSPVELFTPGFSHSRNGFVEPEPEGDLYSLALVMAYFVFPIAAMSYLRENVLDLYRRFVVDGLGWPVRVHELVLDLAHARITLTELLDHLDQDFVGQVEAVPPRPVDPRRIEQAEAGVAAFVLATADTSRATLFPVDPFAHVTNPLSLGFGASGVLWALNASGVPLEPEWSVWLRDRVVDLDATEYPDGLMNGLAGIAWAADALGLRAEARELLAQANLRGPEVGDHTYYYGLSGLGMTNLHFHLRDRDPGHLAAARECARVLCDTARHEGEHTYWLNDFATDEPLTGLGFGQAGVAMFLLRLHQVTGDESYLRLGRRALAWELTNVVPLDGDLVMFRHENTLEPYVEVGSAGVAKVLLRYGDLEPAHAILRGLDVGCSVLAGYGYGLSGVADTLLDAAEITGDASYRATALRQLEFVREVFLFEPAERFGLARPDGPAPLAVPGEGLLRCACDYFTGAAGVLRVLRRANHGGTADFLLDEVTW
ncbi:class III lanthionine synthetase LanKC [Actinosynnema sp. NPDC020468]|uniref:class III lanthionine synthetase LanKC n=1 Tax=Actinosynnema sp. NPDC020468 TaxID=3154488 RepID=UPI0033CCD697